MNALRQATPEVEGKADRRSQERRWLVSRAGWALMLATVVAAAMGLTGSGGALSRAHIEAGTARIDAPRISRWASADHLTIEFGAETRGPVRVMVPQAFIDTFAIEAVSPRPSSVVATPEGHRFEFEFAAVPGKRSAQFSIRAGSPSLPTGIGRFEVEEASASEIEVVVLP